MTDDEIVELMARAIYEATPHNKPYSLLTKIKRDTLEVQGRVVLSALKEAGMAIVRRVENDALMDCQYVVGVDAGWNAANSESPNEKLAALIESGSRGLVAFAAAEKDATP